MGADLVRASSLSRRFEARLAIEDLTFTVGAGEILALLGPNGAGKTTTFRILAGLFLPTSGVVEVDGVTLDGASADRVRRRVGLLTETPGLWERLSVRANLLTYARLHGIAAAEARVQTVMDEVGIAARADDRAGTLSKGLKQRAAIARALVHDPPVVLLDEPTAGLDPESARGIRELVRRLRGDGRAVLVSTHNLAEAETLADRIAVMNTRLLAIDTPRALRERRRGGHIVMELDHGAEPWRHLVEQAGARVMAVSGGRLVVARAPHLDVPDLVSLLVRAGARVRQVTEEEPTLEDAYLELVRRHA